VKFGPVVALAGSMMLLAGCADPSGVAMPVGDLPGWHQIFADNFGNPNDPQPVVPEGAFSGCGSQSVRICSGLAPYPGTQGNWWAYPDGWAGSVGGQYSPSNSVSLDGGVMTYRQRVVGGTQIIDALAPKVPGTGAEGGRLYGRYSVRARWDTTPGWHISFLLWPDSGTWPRDGEIDFPEADTQSSSVSAFLHWQGGTTASSQTGFHSAAIDPSKWHTYTTEWTADHVSFSVDGTVIGTSTDASKIPNTPMHWVLQTNGVGSTPPAGATNTVQIDWAVAYS
jgi:hypothetical protein